MGGFGAADEVVCVQITPLDKKKIVQDFNWLHCYFFLQAADFEPLAYLSGAVNVLSMRVRKQIDIKSNGR